MLDYWLFDDFLDSDVCNIYLHTNFRLIEKNVNNYLIYEKVDYSATADDLERHFHGCGSVNRVTILCDKYSGHPKGYLLLMFICIYNDVIDFCKFRFAYIEFADKDSVETATALDESLFKGRQIRVCINRRCLLMKVP